MARQAQVDLEREKKELEDSMECVSNQAKQKVREGEIPGGGGHGGCWREALSPPPIKAACHLLHGGSGRAFEGLTGHRGTVTSTQVV